MAIAHKFAEIGARVVVSDIDEGWVNI